MAFVRNSRGVKNRFSVAKVANRISKTYYSVMGDKTTYHRKKIQEHSKNVFMRLRMEYGDDLKTEWSRRAIAKAIEQELLENSIFSIQERYLEEEESKKTFKETNKDSNKVDKWAQYDGFHQENPDKINPSWTVFSYQKGAEKDEQASNEVLDLLGDVAKPSKKENKKEVLSTETTRRSDWILMWQQMAVLAKEPFDMDLFEAQILRSSPTMRHMDHQAWWNFWQKELDVAISNDPRTITLMRVAYEKMERTRILGQNWLAGTKLTPHTPLILSFDYEGNEKYRYLWMEHIQHIIEEEKNNDFQVFDLEKLAQALKPERDRDIDWRGIQWMTMSECLWPITKPQWDLLPKQLPTSDARELAQWAWMRTAMAMAIREPKPNEAAIAFYEQMSQLLFIPSETLCRESGKANPRFLEDEAGAVKDKFESIYDTIHRAAVGTKWTGTISLDWRDVRAKGATIAGRRISQGPLGFMNSINSMLAAQGRQGEDRPVTVILPIWHRDIEFMLQDASILNRLQMVISIPDVFFEKMKKGKPWLLLDPAAYSVLTEGKGNYLEAEAQWEISTNQQNNQISKVVDPQKLWKKILKVMSGGNLFVTFEDSDKAFTPFPETAPPVGGIDGVGALPIERNSEEPFISWPAGAVNLAKLVSDDGKIEIEAMKDTSYIALRILDNAIALSNLDPNDPILKYRAVCLGAVGFFEAVNKGVVNNIDDKELSIVWTSGLAEMWASTVMVADQTLRKERGCAPAFLKNADARTFDPLGSLERLRDSRGGSLGHRPKPEKKWDSSKFKKGHRFSVRTVWAPYLGAAKIAGVTPGGMGTLRPTESVLDESGNFRTCPTPLLLEVLKQRPEEIEIFGNVIKYPENTKKWPPSVVSLSYPTSEGWGNRLNLAAHIRTWIDQGVSLTLPAGLSVETLSVLIQQAWWLGLSNVRFDGKYNEENEGETEKMKND